MGNQKKSHQKASQLAKMKMNPLSYDLGNALLTRHGRICSKYTGGATTVPEDLIDEAILSYKALLREVGAPESLAEWCKVRNLPPINALAVNAKHKRPGTGYYTAPGCGDWDQEVRECIACKRYPASISN
jgi:hypothetical protein